MHVSQRFINHVFSSLCGMGLIADACVGKKRLIASEAQQPTIGRASLFPSPRPPVGTTSGFFFETRI